MGFARANSFFNDRSNTRVPTLCKIALSSKNMRATRFHGGSIHKSLSLHRRHIDRTIASASYSSSSQTQTPSSQQTPTLHKTFFKSQNRDRRIKDLSKDIKFEQIINNLCEENCLNEATDTLGFIERPTESIYSKLLQLCNQQRALEQAKRVHSHTKRSGSTLGVSLSKRLLHLYCKCGSLVDARKVFDEMTDRDLNSWNVIIAGCVRAGQLDEARSLFDLMPERDNFSWNNIISCYIQHGRVSDARELFDQMKERDTCSWNVMVNGYAKKGRLREARSLFDKMPEKDDFSWTAIISGYVKHDHPNDAIELYRIMQRSHHFKGNQFTVTSALAATATIQCLGLGKEIHGHILRMGLDTDAVVSRTLSDMYGKCGCLVEAKHIFDRRKDNDVISWTAMIDKYFQSERREEGYMLFLDLLRSGIRPNDSTLARILNVCAQQCREDLGTQVHGYIMRIGFNQFSFAASALVSMYCKCGNIEIASRVFKLIPNPDLFSWTSLISGYAQNGQPHEALTLFESLLESGTKPDYITFVGVLSACTHAGLVDKGLEYFNSIEEKHGLAHTAEHYTCVVDLLSRTGRLSEAEEMLRRMVIKPNKFMWASLLRGCRVHGNLELAKRAAEALFEIEPENPATYVTLANMYAAVGKWDDVVKIRGMMDTKGVVKNPGVSWTEIKRNVYVFFVGDTSNPKYKEIQELLGELLKRMRQEGYTPGTDNVLHDVEEEQKEQNLSYHSEKLAVGFAIIATPPGMPIKVFKNLRTCVDCHTAFKFISKIVDRKITIRDSSRFHCFEGGGCSCKDFW